MMQEIIIISLLSLVVLVVLVAKVVWFFRLPKGDLPHKRASAQANDGDQSSDTDPRNRR